MSSKLILIIDDDTDILDLLRGILEAEGYHTVTSVVADGLPTAEAPQPDIILLDVMLSGGENGLEVCQKLKQQVRTQHIPIVLMSAHTSLRTMAAGLANACLSKPFDLDTLYHVVEEQLV